jgi:Fe-S-cluster containining protein
MGDLAEIRVRTNCAECVNKCCSQPLDWVYVTEAEIVRLEAASTLPRSEFIEPIQNQLNGLTFQTLQLPCRFLDAGGKCSVYSARPLICQIFPFYPDPLVARLMFLPAECGDRLSIITDDSRDGWSASDFSDQIEAWYASIWSEAAGR